MVNRLDRNQSGQSIVVIALAMMAIIAMAALVLDGGYALLERRRMQNAADSAALAGVRSLAKKSNEIAIRAEIDNYARRNDVVNPDTDITAYFLDADGNVVPNQAQQVGHNGQVPKSARAIWVQARRQHPTFFAGAIGFPTIQVAAISQAGYDAAARVPGTMPFAVYTQTLEAGDALTLWDSDCLNAPDAACVGGKDHRGWLNLDGSGQGNDLVTWMTYGYSLDTDVPMWINGAGGVHDSAVQAATQWIGKIIFIPMYDYYVIHTATPPGPDPYPNPGNQQRDYHIIGFGAFLLDSVVSNGKEKGLQGTFVSWVGSQDAGGGADFGVTAIRLTKPVNIP